MAAYIWAAWGEEWQFGEKVSFNGSLKTITVNSGVITLDIRSDVYSAWARWMIREDNSRFIPAIRASGGDAIPGGETGITFFMTNGWKLIYDPSTVTVSGVLYSDDYATAFWSYSGHPVYPATVSSLVNTAVIYQNVVTGTVPTPTEITTAVWGATDLADYPSGTAASELQSKPDSNEIWQHPFVSKLLTIAKFLALK